MLCFNVEIDGLQEIESLYKKDSIGLGEASQLLQRVVQYEIPALRRNIQKADQAIQVKSLFLFFYFPYFSRTNCHNSFDYSGWCKEGERVSQTIV